MNIKAITNPDIIYQEITIEYHFQIGEKTLYFRESENTNEAESFFREKVTEPWSQEPPEWLIDTKFFEDRNEVVDEDELEFMQWFQEYGKYLKTDQS